VSVCEFLTASYKRGEAWMDYLEGWGYRRRDRTLRRTLPSGAPCASSTSNVPLARWLSQSLSRLPA